MERVVLRATPIMSALVLTLLAGAAQAAPTVNVTFDRPERFADASVDQYRSEQARLTTIKAIREHLQKLGQQHLQKNQTLEVEFLDIDLAGEFEPLRSRMTNVRVMRSETWPRLKLRYTLLRGDQVVTKGEETLIDMSYLGRADVRASSDLLRYEKALLADWFRERIVQGKPGPN